MGLVRLDGFSRHRHHGRGAKEAANEIVHQVTMIAIEDLPEEMQCHMVGVPRDWVCILRHVANAVVNVLASHPEPGR